MFDLLLHGMIKRSFHDDQALEVGSRLTVSAVVGGTSCVLMALCLE